jgi:hypothetical protein
MAVQTQREARSRKASRKQEQERPHDHGNAEEKVVLVKRPAPVRYNAATYQNACPPVPLNEATRSLTITGLPSGGAIIALMADPREHLNTTRMAGAQELTRRQMFALPSGAVLQGAYASIPSPDRFPWAVDKSAHLGRRRITPLGKARPHPSGFNLAALDRALNAVMRSPEDAAAIRVARQELADVQAATSAPELPANWREVHHFATILLNAPVWHLAVTASA